nr:calcium-binding protein [Paracoccus sp. S-4012]
MTAISTNGVLTISGDAAPGGTAPVRITGGAGAAEVRDTNSGTVPIKGPATGIGIVDASSLSAAVAIEWTLAGPAADLRGGGGADVLTAKLARGADPARAAGASLNGDAGHDRLTGSAAGDTLRGGTGNDSLDGGAGDDLLMNDAGNDLLIGGDGEDTVRLWGGGNYVVDLRITDGQVTGLGRDTLIGVEHLIGGWGTDLLTGTDAANHLDGHKGDDTLIGLGGDDVYYVDSAADLVIEAAGQGFDTILTTVDYALPDHVEALVLTVAGLSGTGNAGDNLLVSRAGGGRLDAGAGNDTLVSEVGRSTLIGGAGGDLYVSHGPDDVIVEWDGGGEDTLQSSVSAVLWAGVEHLELIGTAAINGTGNAGNNRIVGNDAANVLSGGGGRDTLIGGKGDDTYDARPGDLIIELAGGGIDTLLIRESMALPDHVENIVIIGPGPIDATGNDLANRIAGNDWANVLTGGKGADTLIGGRGNDTYVIDALDTVIEEAGGGIDTILFNGSLTLPDHVENAISAAGFGVRLAGNALDNRLESGAGNDTLEAGEGADVLIGGGGDDLYLVGTDDTVIELEGGGEDTVRAAGSYALGDWIEVLVLLGGGDGHARGNRGNNHITGTPGANVIDGYGGSDTLVGGAGDDIYIVDGEDLVIEAAGGGYDTVFSTATYELPQHVEALHLSGAADIDGTGNDLDNVIVGNAGRNQLTGGGGADTLMGGAGDDFYITDGLDTIVEVAGGGRDVMWSPVTATIMPHVEILMLGGTNPIAAYGREGDDWLMGNDAANTLAGGAGADTMSGGLGDDLYIVEGPDTIFEAPGAGIDTVHSPGSFTLPAHVEHLVLTGAAGALLRGNDLPNRLTGGPGADTLLGLGAFDTLIGGGGDDTYFTDGFDLIVEAANGGWDTVFSIGNYVLPDHVDALELSGTAFAGRGNAAANYLVGNASANHLSGGGGRDTLVGLGGDDTYVVDADDLIVERAGGGYDHAMAQSSFTLPDHVERLTLLAGATGIGNAGDNVVVGNAGPNLLAGRQGNDHLVGGPGNDTLTGDLGNDTLQGGAGADRFVFAAGGGTDMIADFQNGIDQVQLIGLAHSLADLQIEQRGAHTLLLFRGDYLYFINTDMRLLDGSDFIFT